MNFRSFTTVIAPLALTISILFVETTAHGLSAGKDIAQYLHKWWEVEDGLPQSEVTALIQEPSGHITFGTQEGLVRFDGIKFHIFDKINTPELADNIITELWLNPNGNLWIGTESSLVRRVGDHFENLSAGTPLEGRCVTSLTADRHGGIWIGTRSSGLFYKNNGQFVSFEDEPRLKGASIQHLMTDRGGNVWVSSHKGLFRIRKQKVALFGVEDGLPDLRVNVVYQHRGRHLWVGTESGLCLFDGRTCTPDSRNDKLPDKRVRTILRDKDRTLWLGTFTGGLIALRKNKVHAAGELVGINREINDLLEDHEGSLWIATGINGLHQLFDGKVSNFRFELSPTSDAVMTLLVDSKGVLWAGMENGLVRYDGDNTEFITSEDGLLHEYVIALAESRKGGLWVGTNGGGFAHYHRGKFRFFGEEDGLADGRIRSIYEALDGTLWVGTRGGGLHLFKNDKLVAHYTTETGLISNRIIAIAPESSGDALLLGTANGIVRYQNGRFEDLFKRMGIPPGVALSFHKDNQGRLYVGTSGDGVYVIDNNKFYNIDTSKGLYDDVVFAIVPDTSGNLWMSSNKGIFKVSQADILAVINGSQAKVVPTSFDTSDGMLNRECNGGSYPVGWRSAEGKLWFATVGGAVLVEPDNIFTNAISPPVAIEQLSVDGQTRNPGAVLSPDTERLEFHFSALSFIAPERNTFSYMLEGFDNKWQEAGTQRFAHYTKVPPANYRFLVKAKNSDGVESTEPAEFGFAIEPMLVQTTWFQVLMIVLVVLALAGIVILRDRQVRSRNAQLSAMAWQQTSKILQSQVDRIHNLTRTAQAVSKTTQQSMSDLAQSAEGVSRAVNETSVRVSDINEGGLKAEGSAKQIGKAVKTTQLEFVEGNRAAQQSSEIIMQIRSDSMVIADKIQHLLAGIAEAGRILTIVKDIADKSKILAINASIEASKAGIAGKGFGVVAHKMRELALSSHDSAKEISTLLGSLEHSVVAIDHTAEIAKTRTEEGAQRISSSGNAINNLTDKMTQNRTLSDRIIESMEDQLVGLNHITAAISQIKSNSYDNLQISREVEGGAQKLYQSIDDLLEAVASWEAPDFYRSNLDETKGNGNRGLFSSLTFTRRT